MCGVIATIISSPTDQEFVTLENVFLQSKIRGLHATGVSYIQNGKIETVKEPIDAKEFLSKHNLRDFINEDGNLYLIGHTRYSTSDLRFNQPFSSERFSIVHNGVISQESPDTWQNKYNLLTETANDSELILSALEEGKEPAKFFTNASFSMCVLTNEKSIRCIRNEYRPLHYATIGRGVIFASTEDILRRSGLTSIQKSGKLIEYTIRKDSLSNEKIMERNIDDLQ